MRIMITALAVVIIAAVRYFIPIDKIVFYSTLIVILTACVEMFVHLPMYFNSISYTATDTEVMKSSGVFFKVHQSIRYTSIQ